MVNNSATFVILILGWCLLNEKVSAFTLSTLAISFGGTILMLMAAAPQTEVISGEVVAAGTSVFGLIFLLANPIVIGAGVIAMRKMKKMHEAVITTYMNLMLLVIMMSIVYSTGSDLSPWLNFGWLSWLAIAGLSISNVGSQTFRFRAVQRSQVSKLQPLAFT